ncbi:hypothetical protein, partial [Paraburkholderia saeva]|uniref:hypothetical protein n=1 Tax=Paraburkholderia saeva TaxID=2777537 RepID=UPI001E52C821
PQLASRFPAPSSESAKERDSSHLIRALQALFLRTGLGRKNGSCVAIRWALFARPSPQQDQV